MLPARKNFTGLLIDSLSLFEMPLKFKPGEREHCKIYSVEMNLALLMFFSRPYAIASDSGELLRVTNGASRCS